ncbi:MAG: calcium-transporting P-type ATPase, PMR1-type [Limnochordia bacterium]
MQQGSWFRMEPDQIAQILQTDLQAGLTEKKAAGIRRRYGPNRLKEQEGISPLAILLDQFRDFMVLVLLGATAISVALGEMFDALAIIVIVLLNAILGFIQEYRAEKSLAALKNLAAPTTTVLREGEWKTIPAEDLVPGDLVAIEAGDRVPADLRLVATYACEIDEATLTGESIPTSKHASWIGKAEADLADQKNMAFMGTVVTKGRAQGMVIATGMDTEIGKIAHLITGGEPSPTPLQRRLQQLGTWLILGCLSIVGLVFAAGLAQGYSMYKMFMTAVSLAVAAIPEGLPAVVTIALAVGVQRMSKRQAIVRRLPAVETLGCTTYICSDKTGTLTENQMTVTSMWLPGMEIAVTGIGYKPQGQFLMGERTIAPLKDDRIKRALEVCLLCNNSHLRKDKGSWTLLGDPTEGALLALALKAGLDQKRTAGSHPLLAELPFDSYRKMMTVIVKVPQGQRALTKGALEMVLPRCSQILTEKGIRPLTQSHRQQILKANEGFTNGALRVLALAYRDGRSIELARAEEGLVFIGLVGMIDPPRPQVKRALKRAAGAGIRTIMITGDHHFTAAAIARQLGLLPGGEILTGVQLDGMSDEELRRRVEKTAVFARVSPQHKMRIVAALKERGHVVGMTGDGVNDAPAVKEADIGIAMGLTGTDVTKEAAAMVLADDNYATIIAAIEEGRAIYDNIRKFIRYLLSCNVGEVLTMFGATMLSLPLPLIPMQILWMNLVTDGLPAIALGVDPADRDVMQRPPRPPREGIFARGLHFRILLRGIMFALCTLAAFYWILTSSGGDLERARTVAFTTLVISQLIHVFQCRSEYHSIFELGFFSNPHLVLAVLTSGLMQLGVIYWPLLQPVFRTVPLDVTDWLLVALFSGWSVVLDGLFRSVRGKTRRRLSMVRV